MLKEKTREVKEAVALLSSVSAGLKSGLSPELSLERAITNYDGPLKPALLKVRENLIVCSLSPDKALKQFSEKIGSPRLRIAIQILSFALQKDALKAGEMLEEILSELIEDLKITEERERQLKTQEIKLKITIFATSCAQGALSSLIPQLKLTLTSLLRVTPEQNWVIPLALAASLTLTTYIIARATSLNRATTPLTALASFLTSFYAASAF
ncbi:MAG: hypothetical protein KIH01_07715, partial [Candidatus Freyarchaeota archaeon]|nr:hypothetical protein [Candidatus Jordarchaeia archaeon]